MATANLLWEEPSEFLLFFIDLFCNVLPNENKFARVECERRNPASWKLTQKVQTSRAFSFSATNKTSTSHFLMLRDSFPPTYYQLFTLSGWDYRHTVCTGLSASTKPAMDAQGSSMPWMLTDCSKVLLASLMRNRAWAQVSTFPSSFLLHHTYYFFKTERYFLFVLPPSWPYIKRYKNQLCQSSVLQKDSL